LRLHLFNNLYLCSTHKLWKVKSIVKVSCMLWDQSYSYRWAYVRKTENKIKCQGNLLKRYSQWHINMVNRGGKTPPHMVLCKAPYGTL